MGDTKKGGQKPAEKHKEPAIIKETILIVGTEMHTENPADKLMFAAQAIRALRILNITTPEITFIMFEKGYEKEHIDAVEAAAKAKKTQIKFLRIKEDDELTLYLNNGSLDEHEDLRRSTKHEKREKLIKIERIYSFSHGVTQKITYNLTNEELDHRTPEASIRATMLLNANEYTMDDASKLKRDSFTGTAELYYYACRTGVGTVGEDITKEGLHPEKSIAQRIADSSGAKVYAYGSRTDYTRTWGTSGVLGERYDATHGSYDIHNSKDMDMLRQMIPKEQNIGKSKALWNPDGAYFDVMAGTSPTGGIFKVLTFTPKIKLYGQ